MLISIWMGWSEFTSGGRHQASFGWPVHWAGWLGVRLVGGRGRFVGAPYAGRVCQGFAWWATVGASQAPRALGG